jgi:hypothetical protein
VFGEGSPAVLHFPSSGWMLECNFGRMSCPSVWAIFLVAKGLILEENDQQFFMKKGHQDVKST